MDKRLWAAAIAALYLTACTTQEAPKPQPTPAPEAAPTSPASPQAVEPVTPVAKQITIGAKVLFNFDRATIKPTGRSALDEVASKSRDVALESIVVTGHTDRIGSADYNMRLSTRRADAVKAYLVSKGFDEELIHAEGRGESQSVTGDKCRKMGRENRHNKKLIACLQPDRRVEIEVIGTRTR